MTLDYSTATLADEQPPVAWAAIIAGAVAALALSFTLLAIAAGFGLALASPWPRAGGDHTDFTPLLGTGLVIIQVLACAFGGYIAGRLRTRWGDVHSHEVHFRDTAHGMLAWALATVAGVGMAAVVLTAPTAAATGAAANQAAAAVASDPGVLAEPLTPAGAAARPGVQTPVLTPQEAAQAQAAAERAKNLAAQASLFMGIGLLLSAFVAGVAAALGGMRRDDMHVAWLRGRPPTPV